MQILEKLSKITKIISHSNCADGTTAAIIVATAIWNTFHRKVEIEFHQYNTPEHLSLKAEPGLIFTDFSPPKGREKEFIDVGAIVLDHHETQKEVVLAFGDNGIYSELPGVSGAVLAAEFCERAFHNSGDVLETARLIGIRDTWQKQNPDWERACNLQSGVLFYPVEFWKDKISNIGNWVEFWDGVANIGKISVQKHLERCKAAIKGGLNFTSDKGTKVVVIDGLSLSSDASDMVDVDLLVAFGYVVEDLDGQMVPHVIFSTRSRKNFDCAGFAKFNGGGGHLRAAGFKKVAGSQNPYQEIRDLVNVFEAVGLKIA